MSILKVLYHHRTQGRGVEAVHILAVVNGLRSREHSVSIVSPPGADPAVGNFPAKTPNPFWNAVSLRMPQVIFEFLEIAYNVVGCWRLLSRMREGAIDVLYERYALFLFVGVAVCRFKRIPVVLEVNDSAYVKRVRPILNRWLAQRIELWAFREADALIVVTEAFKRILVSSGVDPVKVFVVHNAAEEELFSPAIAGQWVRERHALKSNAVVVGFVGKVVPWHGVNSLIEAVPKIVAEFRDASFMIVGDTGGDQSVHELVNLLGVGESVTFTGQVSHQDVPSYLAIMDIAVMPNTNEFGSPVKIFEYMAMGRAIIAPRRGPIEEILVHEETAILVDPSKPHELVEALRTLVRDGELRTRLGAAARREFVTNHTLRHQTDRTIEVLHWAILSRKERRR